jgi:hypothetical protein
VCYSTDAGATWVTQTEPAAALLVQGTGTRRPHEAIVSRGSPSTIAPPSTPTAGPGTTVAADTATVAALIGVSVGAFLALALLAVVVGLMLHYRKDARQLAFFNKFFGTTSVAREVGDSSARAEPSDAHARDGVTDADGRPWV